MATLCTLRLLGMDPDAASHIHCITFACVAIGNPEVMRMVHANGWSHLFQNFILPGARLCSIPAYCTGPSVICATQSSQVASLLFFAEDDVVRLALLMQLKGLPSVTREVAAHALAMPAFSSDVSAEKPTGPASADHPNHQLLHSSLAFLNRFTIEDLTTLPFAAGSGTAAPSSGKEHLRSDSENQTAFMHMPAAEPQGHPPGAPLAAAIRPSGGGRSGWNIPFQAHQRRSPTLRAVGGRTRSSSPLSSGLRGRDPPSPSFSHSRQRGRSPPRGRNFTNHAVAGVMAPDRIFTDVWKDAGDVGPRRRHMKQQQQQQLGQRSLSAPLADTGADPNLQVDLERLSSMRSAISDSDGMAAMPAATTSGPGERRRRRAAVAALTAARDRAGAKLAGLWSAAQTGASRFNDHYNVIPSYHPFGLQLYLNPEGVSVGLHSDDVESGSPSSSGSGGTAQSHPPRHEAAERVTGDDLPGEVGDDLEHEVSDLVDRGALLPQPLQAASGRGKVFHMHRMFNYRHRLLHLLAIMDVLPGPYVPPPVRDRSPAPSGGDGISDAGSGGGCCDEEGEQQLDAGVARLAEEIIPELQPAHVEVQVNPVGFEVRGGSDSSGTAAAGGGPRRGPWGRAGRGQAGRLARHCDADVCVQGSGLGFVSGAAVEVAGVQVEATLRAVGAAATERCMRVKLPMAVVQDAAMRPTGNAAVSLRSDFTEVRAEAHVRVPQCVVVGSADDTVCGVMHALATAAPADMHGDGAAAESRGEAAPRSWAQALRPMKILQRLPWRSRPRSLDLAADTVPLEPPPVAVCGGVRYVDACWDFAMRRLSDAATARSLFELAAVLQQQTWREQHAARRRGAATDARADAGVARALGALVSHFTARVSYMRVAVAHRLCMVRRGAWAAILHVSALTSHGIWRMQLASSHARMRMLATQPTIPAPRGVEPSAVQPDDVDADGDAGVVPVPETSPGAVASQEHRAAEQSRLPRVGRRPRMRIPRALRRRGSRWFPERGAGGDAEAHEDIGSLVAEFLYNPAGAEHAGVQACMDAMVVAEDVQLWRGQRAPVVTRRRRRAVARVVEAAVARGAHVVLVLSVPDEAGQGQAFEWLEEVTQMRAAYGLQDVEHRVVVLDAGGEGAAACTRLHNAVVTSLSGHSPEDDDVAQMNSKL